MIVPLETLHSAPAAPEWSDSAVLASQVDGMAFGLPFGSEADVLAYRADIYGSAPDTWSQLLNGPNPFVFPANDPRAGFTMAQYLGLGGALLDAEGRPKFAYGSRIHDQCPRRAHFDAGQYVEQFDDDFARKGWCLYRVGCKGPATFSPCPIFMWNTGTSWPIGAGHPGIGCTEPQFWDTMSPFYTRLPDVGGFGVESKVDMIGAAAAIGSTAGVIAHAAMQGLHNIRSKKQHDIETVKEDNNG